MVCHHLKHIPQYDHNTHCTLALAMDQHLGVVMISISPTMRGSIPIRTPTLVIRTRLQTDILMVAQK